MSAAFIPTIFPLFIVIAIKRAEERIHRQLSEARATTAETAIALSTTRSIDQRRLEHLVRGGAVRVNASGLHYLDADGWRRHLEARRRRVFVALTIVLVLLGVGIAIAVSLR